MEYVKAESEVLLQSFYGKKIVKIVNGVRTYLEKGPFLNKYTARKLFKISYGCNHAESVGFEPISPYGRPPSADAIAVLSQILLKYLLNFNPSYTTF